MTEFPYELARGHQSAQEKKGASRRHTRSGNDGGGSALAD